MASLSDWPHQRTNTLTLHFRIFCFAEKVVSNRASILSSRVARVLPLSRGGKLKFDISHTYSFCGKDLTRKKLAVDGNSPKNFLNLIFVFVFKFEKQPGQMAVKSRAP